MRRRNTDDRWQAVNWAWPVTRIAAALRVSRQRVYQVIAARGIQRPRVSIRRRLADLETAPRTVSEIASLLGYSRDYVRGALRATGRPYRRPCRPAAAEGAYAPFAAWLAQRGHCAPATVRALCTRCRRVEAVYGLHLRAVLGDGEGLARLLERVRATPAALLEPGTQPAMLNSYRTAVRRYAAFLAAGSCQEPSGRERTAGGHPRIGNRPNRGVTDRKRGTFASP
jgi:hypothetical protein